MKKRALTAPARSSRIALRSYQVPVFADRSTPVLVLHWSRQIGKSFTLAAWAVDRLLTRPGRLVVVLSNSRDNGAEFARKCAEICQRLQVAAELVDESAAPSWEDMRFEVRITVGGVTGRIKVLAANPRTARGFSGDLILDEFAFHDDATAIWDAAEPILASNPDYLCRIASTGNGTGNLFYRLATSGLYPVSRVTRTDAWRAGVKIRSALTGAEITPEQARAEALDKASYDQNYECAFASEASALITHEMVNAAEDAGCGEVCDGAWSEAALARLRAAEGRCWLGWDVARRGDLSVVAVLERVGGTLFARAILRMRALDFTAQIAQVEAAARACRWLGLVLIDQTGLGEGPTDFAIARLGRGRVRGIHFSSSLPLSSELTAQGERGGVAPAPLVLASRLHRLYMEAAIVHPADTLLRDDLRKPRRVVLESGRVSIKAEGGPDGHADHFWALALAAYGATADTLQGAITAEAMPQVLVGRQHRSHWMAPLGRRPVLA